jgi:peptide deformylase
MTTSTINEENYTLEGENLKIFTYPAAVLKKVAEPVTEFDADLEALVKNMLFTMYKAPGIGLAAPQVGVSKRLFVMDIDFDREEITKADGTSEYTYSNFKPLVIINPEFVDPQGEQIYEEGCLSVPGIYEKVTRAEKIKVKYQNLKGEHIEMYAEGLLAVCLQHENDHLDGIVFLERLSQLKQNFLKKKFLKNKKKG